MMTYAVRNTKETTKKKKTTAQTVRYDVSIEVLEETDTSYTLEWTCANYTSDTKLSAIEKIFVDLILLDNYSVRYQVSEYGDILRVLNWKEIQTVVFQSVEQAMSVSKLSDNKKADVIKLVKSQFSSQEQIETFVIQDIKKLHYLYRLILFRAEPAVYEKYYVNPFMDEFFLGTEQQTVETVDEEHMEATVLVKAKLPEENTRKLMTAYMDKVVGELGSKEKMPADEIPLMSITETSRYQLDLEYGTVLRLDYKRRAKVAEETTTISYHYRITDI